MISNEEKQVITCKHLALPFIVIVVGYFSFILIMIYSDWNVQFHSGSLFISASEEVSNY